MVIFHSHVSLPEDRFEKREIPHACTDMENPPLVVHFPGNAKPRSYVSLLEGTYMVDILH